VALTLGTIQRVIPRLRWLPAICLSSFILTACASSSTGPGTLNSPKYINSATASVNTFQWVTSSDGKIAGSTHSYSEMPGGHPVDNGSIRFSAVRHGSRITFDFHPANGRTGSLRGTIGHKGLTIHYPSMGGCQESDTDLFVPGSPSIVESDIARMTGASECP
jgi:hypothetical protein